MLRYIFNIDFIRPSKLPKRMFYTSDKCKCALLQALYDDEGTTSNNTTIGMSSLSLIEEIKSLIENLDIKTTKITFSKGKIGKGCYYFSISEKCLQKFKEKIGFLHPQKAERLNFKLKIKERNKIQRTRHLDWTREQIVNLLKKTTYDFN